MALSLLDNYLFGLFIGLPAQLIVTRWLVNWAAPFRKLPKRPHSSMLVNMPASQYFRESRYKWEVLTERDAQEECGKPSGGERLSQKLRAFADSFRGGRVIGVLEVIFVYTALCAARDQVGIIVGAYLAFKVASKWEVWSHVYRLPEKLSGVDDREWLLFRAAFGHHLFTRFIVGTVTNLLIAGFAFLVFDLSRYPWQLLRLELGLT